MNEQQYDVIIIGSGAGGGTLAYKLAATGKRILLLERGDFLPREKENWNPYDVFVKARYKAPEIWYDQDRREFHPGIQYFVGGNTKVYGAVLLRFRKEDFGEIKHAEGISPAWPITYEEMEPYYTQAEKLYCVHGLRGIDPTEPPCSHPYFFPPVANEPRIQEIYDRLTKKGLHPFPLPLGLLINEADMSKSRCIKCNTCDGFPCLVDAKSDSEIIAVNPALKHANVTLLTNRYVERLETTASGKEVSQVHVDFNGKKEIYTGQIIVVSCGAINSAALLLRSKNEHYPNGLANSSNIVGRHYMCHNNSALVALSKHLNPTKFQKTLGINDYYFRSEDWEYPLGHIQMLGKSHADMFKADAPRFTPSVVLENMATHAVDFWLTSEDLPLPNNRVLVDSKGNINLHYYENNLEGHKRLIKKLKGMLSSIDCYSKLIPCSAYLGKKIPIAGTAHQCGTIRFGHDSKTSALDINCKAHDVENLYVVDGSFFPSSSAVNPSLTIIANALRVADHLMEKLK